MALSFEREHSEDRSSLAAAAWLGVLFVIGVAVWGRWRDVLLPARNLVRFTMLGAGGAVGLGALCYRPGRRAWWRNGALVVAVAVALVGIAELPSRVELGVREHEAQLVAVADRFVGDPPSSVDGCEPAPRGLSAGDFAPFDQVCSGGGGIEFRINTAPSRTEGLVYRDPGAHGPQSSCVKELFGRWLQFVRPADPNCPFGFTFIGGG